MKSDVYFADEKLKEVYNNAKMRAMPNMMVTFDGDDGAESCDTCQKLKGKRHKISWFVSRNYIPPFGTGLECHPGRRCQHYLKNFSLSHLVFGSGQPLITGGQLRNIEIPFPLTLHQNHIAIILGDMDEEIDLLEQKLTKARQIKQGMMQELLTGRVRLI